MLVYAVCGLAWIIGGDLLIHAWGSAHDRWMAAQILSGLVFLLATSFALAAVLRALVDRIARAHHRLAASEVAYRRMFRAHPGPMLVCGADASRIVDANPAAVAFFGWPRTELLERSLDQLWTGPAGARSLQEQQDTLARPRDGRVTLQDGRQCLVELRDAPMEYDGQPARLVVIGDRTAEHEARNRRDQALARLEEAQDIARLGWWEFDPETGLGLFSRQIYRMLGLRVPPDAMRRHPFEELLSPGDDIGMARLQVLLGTLRSARPVHLDALVPITATDGRRLTVQLRISPAATAGGAGVRGTLQDVTEHENSRRLLHEREEQFKELVRVMPDGVMILHQQHVLYANAACAQQLGYAGEMLLGEALSALVTGQDLPGLLEQLATPAASESGLTLGMRRQDGSVFHAGLSCGAVRYSGRDCTLLIVRDLSEPERMRDALAAGNRELQAMARRLFSLQEDERRALSRDLHDDVGQAITAMKLSAHAAAEEPDASRRQEDLAHIVALADSSITKLRNLSMLLRPPQLDALGLEAAVRWQAAMLFRASPVQLTMEIVPLGRRPAAEAEQACFRIAQESLTNVLRHAHASAVVLRLGPVDEDRLCLEVADDGAGFDPAGPRGLGLIVMRERAQSAGGTLRIDSSPGAGTRVTLHLPCAMVAPPVDALGA